MKSGTTQKLSLLRKLMKDPQNVPEPLAAYLVPSCDAHNSEYLAEVDMRRQYISGFTGSAGSAVITKDQALMWTDGRYYLQAQKEMDSNWVLMKDGLPTTPKQMDWLVKNLEPGSIIGVDPLLVSSANWKAWTEQLESVGSRLHALDQNLVDHVWREDKQDPQPTRPENTVFPLEYAFTGRSWQNKVEEIRKELKENNCRALVLCALDDIAWLLNIRGSDIDFNPVFFSYCVVTMKDVVLFISPKQVNNNLREALSSCDMEESVDIRDYNDIKSYISALGKEPGKIMFPKTASHGLVSLVPARKVVNKLSPVAVMKAVKNDVEMKGFENSHIRDAAALIQYFAWLNKNIGSGQVTEISGADILEQFRKEQEHFMGLSFPSISGVGPNGAIIHYRPEPETDRTITSEEMYLIDSGAQYKDGTTDVTRTLHFGVPTDYEKECFTRVLKGHIQMAMAIFPDKCTGNRLDTLARMHLWSVGLDYGHGTGHGVGAFLNVHEGPSGISYRHNPNDPGVQEGMIFSDEPGYYESGKFGIRIETLVKVISTETKFKSATKMLTFAPITLVPIQQKLIDPKLMTQEEITWLNTYHQTCRDKVAPLLKDDGKKDALEWLYKETQPIG